MDSIGKTAQSVGQLAPVVHPVAQRAVVQIPVAEPAVIQHKQVDACVLGAGSQLQQLLLVKVEIGGFPVVDQQRTGGMGKCAPGDVTAAQMMEFPAHAVQAVGGVAQVGFRGLEILTGLQLPAELEGLNADLNPCHVVAVHEHIGQKAAAVAQGQSIDLARILGSPGLEQRHKGTGLMAAGASNRFHALIAGRQRTGIDLPLPQPCAAQGHQLVVGVFKIHAGAQGFFQHHGGWAAVHYPQVPGNHVHIRVYRIAQLHLNAAVLVPQTQHQRFGVIAPGRGKALQRRLSL